MKENSESKSPALSQRRGFIVGPLNEKEEKSIDMETGPRERKVQYPKESVF